MPAVHEHSAAPARQAPPQLYCRDNAPEKRVQWQRGQRLCELRRFHSSPESPQRPSRRVPADTPKTVICSTNCSAINRNRFALQLVAADTQRPFADPNCSNQFVSTARSAPLPASRFMPKGLQKSDVGVRKEAGAAEARMLTSALGAGVDLQKTTVHTSAHRRAPRSRCH
jgi:hypothetical protein